MTLNEADGWTCAGLLMNTRHQFKWFMVVRKFLSVSHSHQMQGEGFWAFNQRRWSSLPKIYRDDALLTVYRDWSKVNFSWKGKMPKNFRAHHKENKIVKL